MQKHSRPRQALTVVFCLFFVLFLGVADNQVISPLLPAIRSAVGKSSQQVAFLFVGYSLAAGISVLLWGPLSDTFGRKRGLVTGLSIFSVGSFLSFGASGFLPLMAGRIITGMGSSMISLNTLSYAADFFPYEHRGWAMGSIVSSYFAALILGVPLGSFIGDKFGWHAVFAVACGTGLALLICIQSQLPPLHRRESRRFTESVFMTQINTYTGFFGNLKTAGALLSSFFASAGTTGFLSFLGVWLHDAYGLSGRQVGLVFLPSGAAALVASPFAGSLSDRIGKRMQFVLSNVCLALFLLFLSSLQWGPWLFVFCALISLSAAFRQGPMEAILTEVVPGPTRGSFIALKNSFSQVGIALAAAGSGLLFELSGYWAVCLLCAAANLAAALAMAIFVRERRL